MELKLKIIIEENDYLEKCEALATGAYSIGENFPTNYIIIWLKEGDDKH